MGAAERTVTMQDPVTGLYEQLITSGLAKTLDSLQGKPVYVQRDAVDQVEAPDVLARHVHLAVLRALRAVPGTGQEKTARQVDLVNHVLGVLQGAAPSGAVDPSDFLSNPIPEELLALIDHRSPALGPPMLPARPGIPLGSSDLLVNARDEYRIGFEIQQELASADQVDLVCSFLKFSGWRVICDAVVGFLARGGKLRVLTTCYLGATEPRVLDELIEVGLEARKTDGEIPVEVRISYDTRRTRLHAKAWLFHRRSGFSTGYIGSSNLSSAALIDGLEWNVRLSQVETPGILDKFANTFDSYWNDGEFEPYDPSRDRARLEMALAAERGAVPGDVGDLSTFLPSLDIRPFPHQQEILDHLHVERILHGRWRNLVVAATGTGKTVIAALDYARVRREGHGDTLLFVAHREEILQQTLQTFRLVLRDPSFGDLWGFGRRPTVWTHLFASVQTLANIDLAGLDPSTFDVVIVDEFHHAAAPTYRDLLDHLEPRLLVGLTATPERMDGQSVLERFGHRMSVELRLWEAIERGLLCPFQYFGVHDQTDLSHVRFTRGTYDISQLENIYTADHARVRLILVALNKRVAATGRMRALGFCVGVGHARFMASEFTRHGIPSVAVVGDTPPQERARALQGLRDGTLNVIFAVDIFNEGVDVPEIDTVMMLRPTESATIFLQQLGRGLRLALGKDCLTVLDFIGLAHKDFRYDRRFGAIMNMTRAEVARAVERGFPLLPSGCSIQLDRVAQEVVLNNVRQAIRRGAAALIQELRSLGDVSLCEFLERCELEPSDLYRGGLSWTALRQRAGYPVLSLGPDEARLLRAVGRTLHVDDVSRMRFYRDVLALPNPPAVADFDGRQVQMLLMLHFTLWGTKDGPPTLEAFLERLWAHPNVRCELGELLEILEDRVAHFSVPLLVKGTTIPLEVHCSYSRDEILAAFGVSTPERPNAIREGVYFHEPTGCDLFFVTIEKSEKHYSPTTMYQDFAISPREFHWESQSTTRAESPTGRRYRRHGRDSYAMLFVRRSKKDERGETNPYVFIGPASYVRHQGERPMGIVWRLQHPIPAVFFRYCRLAAS